MHLLLLALIFLFVLVVVLAMARRPGAERIHVRVASLATAAPASILEEELRRPFTERLLRPIWASICRLALRLTPSGSSHAIQQLLDTAGNPPRLGIREFVVLRIASGIAGIVAGILIYRWVASFWEPSYAWLAAALAVVGGWTLPVSRLRAVGEERQYRIRKSLPDVLDLLLVSVEAGLGLDGAMAKVVEKMSGPLPDELRRVLESMRVGRSRAQALKDMVRRVQIIELNGFVGAINQADQLGTSIARTLRLQSQEIRIARAQRVQEMAAKLPVKMLFPLIFFIMPATFIVIAGPGFMAMIAALGHPG